MNPKSIADYLTTALSTNNEYQVTDDVQLYDENMKTSKKSYVPAVLTMSPFVEESGFRYTKIFNLHFLFKRSYIDTFYSDIALFIENEKAPSTEGSFYITKTYQFPRMTNSVRNGGVEYYEFDLSFTWVYSLAVIGSSSIIKVDTVAIPFTSCKVEHDTSYIANQSSGNNYRMTNDTINLTIPLILTDSKVSSLYADANSNDYNKTYTLDINGISKSVVLKKAIYTLVKGSGLTEMTLVLDTAYPRVTITLDGETVPQSAYSFNGKKMVIPDAISGAVAKGYPTQKVKSWSITLVKDASTVYAKVIADGYGNTVDTTYTLVRDGVSYTVFMEDFSEGFTETGDMKVDCKFMEK